MIDDEANYSDAISSNLLYNDQEPPVTLSSFSLKRQGMHLSSVRYRRGQLKTISDSPLLTDCLGF